MLAEQGYTRIGLARGRQTGWYYVSASVQDKPVHYVLDTGAATNTLEPDWVLVEVPEVAGLKRGPDGRLPLVVFERNDKPLYPRVTVGPVDLPAMRFHYHPTGFLDQAKQDGVPSWVGILGAPFLRYYSAVIDYRTDSLYLLDPVKREAGLQGEWVAETVESKGVRKPRSPRANTRLAIRGTGGVYESSGVRWDFSAILDLTTTPRQMDWLVRAGPTRTKVIYRLDGDTLTIAGGLLETGRPDTGRPTAFEAGKEDAHVVITFRRVKKTP